MKPELKLIKLAIKLVYMFLHFKNYGSWETFEKEINPMLRDADKFVKELDQ